MIKKLIGIALCALLIGCCGQDCSNEANNEAAVIENIMTRVSVRKFDGKQVEKEKIETMLRAGMAAPTAKNLQPWDFVAITDPAIIDSLKADPAIGHSPIKNDCPLVIMVCGNMEKAAEGPARDFWKHDTSAATENILLAAHAMGLGAVWCAGDPMTERVEAMRRIVGLPSYVTPLCFICIGYPAEAAQPKDKWKTENVHYDKW